MNANTSLVHLLKNKNKRVYIKELKEKYPGGKDNILEYTKENPSLLESYKRERNENIPGPMNNFEISEYLDTSSPDFNQLLENIRSVPVGNETFKDYETAVEKYFSSIFLSSYRFSHETNKDS